MRTNNAVEWRNKRVSQALYRKYRSRSLSEIVGQQHVTDVLSGAFSNGRISHAYLLTGPRGIGKTSVARIIAHEINKLAYSDDPNLDIIEIDAASNRRIDDIRDLREKIHIAPVSTKYKVYIIDEVHMLTGESFNALLKTLEEPPEHAVFILATTELHKVPATIVSRTQRFHFRPVEAKVVAEHLRSIADKEKIEIDDDALLLIAKHGGGSFRDSISLLDQLAHSKQNITKGMVETTLGLVPEEQIKSLTEAIVKRHLEDVLAQLKAASQDGASYVTLTEQLINSLSEAAPSKPEIYTLINQLLEVPKSHSPELKLLATLANYAKPNVTKSLEAAPVVTQKVVASMPVTKLPPKHQTKAAPKEQPKDESPKITLDPPTGEFDWDKVLVATKKYNAPLHSVLSRAKVDYDGATLTLFFTFSLHRKKLENPKYRSSLVKIITDVCGVCPPIELQDPKTQPLDGVSAAVADIMGGGDSVHANI
jgi:DNA polymerase-3 subunit gamma/tau